MQRVLNVVLAAWMGSLWTVCGIVAPSMFALLPERHIAGQVAGHFFRLEAWLGLALGSIVVLLVRRMGAKVSRLDFVLILTAVLAPLASELVLHPLMDAARQSSNMMRFGMLHGASALLFGIACLATLLLVWRLSALSKSAGLSLPNT